MDHIKNLFSFPNPVNEISARVVAAMVVVLSITAIITGEPLLFAALAYGFVARVATGPTLSPMGLLATRVIVPALGNPSRPVPGPPKRFAQTIGLIFSVTALLLLLLTETAAPAKTVVGVLTIFAALEAFVGFCAGCFAFRQMIRFGLVPQSVCRECVVRPAEAVN
ncbi:MAG: DUF4395 domain-containing protein [SAR202 cluster bacterium]|nr:DUF4395 domain-containing protein [SAR202 cluster bacterium]